jgi:phage terminase small subunit
MGTKTGKANHPWNSKRPSPKAVKKALARGDMDALRFALSPRQRAFAEEYIVDFNASAAAIRAGYAINNSERQGYLLVRHEGIAAMIDHLRRSREQRINVVDPDYVVQKITSVMNAEGVRDSDLLRGAELLAKILGMLKERTEISGPDGEAIRIQNEEIAREADSFKALIENIARKKTVYIENAF